MIIKMGSLATQTVLAALSFLEKVSETGYLSLIVSSRLDYEIISGKGVGKVIALERDEYFKEILSGQTLVFFMKYEDLKKACEYAISKNKDVALYCMELDDDSIEESVFFEEVVQTMESEELTYDAVVR